MKKVILALVMTSAMALANTAATNAVATDATTVDATMKLMKQGMDDIQSGFLYNNKEAITKGIGTIESANSIFSKVDVSSFIPHNNKIQVTKNINSNLAADLKLMRKSIDEKNYSGATEYYGKVINDCISCHIIIRRW